MEFNLEESSIQALSNSFTLTRGEKVIQSPHTSPKMMRKVPIIPTSDHQKEVLTLTSSVASKSSLNNTTVVNVVNVNVINGKVPKKIVVNSTSNLPQPPVISTSSSSTNSSSSSTSSLTATSSSKIPTSDMDQMTSKSAILNNIAKSSSSEEAPPIPPRKCLNNVNLISRPQKLPQSFEKSSEEKPIRIAELAQQEESDDSDDDSNPICGPAETISGIIVGEVSFILLS